MEGLVFVIVTISTAMRRGQATRTIIHSSMSIELHHHPPLTRLPSPISCTHLYPFPLTSITSTLTRLPQPHLLCQEPPPGRRWHRQRQSVHHTAVPEHLAGHCGRGDGAEDERDEGGCS